MQKYFRFSKKIYSECCIRISFKNEKNANPGTKVFTLDGSKETHPTNVGRASTGLSKTAAHE